MVFSKNINFCKKCLAAGKLKVKKKVVTSKLSVFTSPSKLLKAHKKLWKLSFFISCHKVIESALQSQCQSMQVVNIYISQQVFESSENVAAN